MKTEIRLSTGSLDLFNDVGLNLNFSVADIRDISKRNTTYSKNILIPGTKNNNLIFNNLFNVNSDTLITDIYLYKPVDAQLYYDSLLIRSGYVKLVNIINTDVGTNYEIQFYSEVANLASVLGDDKIFGNDDSSKDIDVSDLNHYLITDTIEASWITGSTNTGFTYPLIDYNYNQSNIHYLENMKPAMFTKILFDRIIEDAGFTYESSFLTSDPFINLVHPWTGSIIMSDTDWLDVNRIFRVYRGADYFFSGNYTTINFDLKWNDAGNQYNNTGVVSGGINPWSAKVTNKGKYNIKAVVSFRITILANVSNTNATMEVVFNLNGDSGVLTSATPVFFPIQQGTHTITGTTYIDDFVEIDKDEQIYCNLTTFFNNTSSIISLSLNRNILGGWDKTWFKMFPYDISPNAYYGDYIDMSKIFGKKEVKKIDFITSIIKMFNLIVDEDPLNTKKLFIETNQTYYSGGTYRDWTDKMDTSQPIQITKLTEYVDKSFYLSYKSDTDTMNTDYTDKLSTIYGEKIDYDDIKSTEYIKIEPIFSPTPIDYYGDSPMIVSKIYEMDFGEPFDSTDDKLKSRDFNPRILYYNHIPISPADDNFYGVLRLSGTSSGMVLFTYKGFPTSAVHRFIPYAGHLDNPYDINYDYNFGSNTYYYPDFSGGTMTYKNLWWTYYRNFLDSILDHDSKMVIMYLRLNEVDIANLRFRDTIRIDNTSYIINKIIDWNPDSICKVELLKLSKNYLKTRSSTSGSPGNAYRINLKARKNTISLVKPDRSLPIMEDASGNTITFWDWETYGDFPISYKNSNTFSYNSNCVISGVYNKIGGAYNTFITGDNNDIEQSENGIQNENIIIIGSNNII